MPHSVVLQSMLSCHLTPDILNVKKMLKGSYEEF